MAEVTGLTFYTRQLCMCRVGEMHVFGLARINHPRDRATFPDVYIVQLSVLGRHALRVQMTLQAFIRRRYAGESSVSVVGMTILAFQCYVIARVDSMAELKRLFNFPVNQIWESYPAEGQGAGDTDHEKNFAAASGLRVQSAFPGRRNQRDVLRHYLFSHLMFGEKNSL